jgi:aconitate hydratase
MLLGADNAFIPGEIGKGKTKLTGQKKEFAQVAREYQKAGKGWMIHR